MKRFAALLAMAGSAWAQRPAEFHDPDMESKPLPAIAVIVFAALLWALLAKNGPLHDLAEAFPISSFLGAAVIAALVGLMFR
jgi:hypothetical protein